MTKKTTEQRRSDSSPDLRLQTSYLGKFNEAIDYILKRSPHFNGSRGNTDKHRNGIKAFISLMDVKIRDVNGNEPFSRRSWEYLPDKNDTRVTYIVRMLSFFLPSSVFFFFFFLRVYRQCLTIFKDKHQILRRGNASSSCSCQEIKEAACSALLRLLRIQDPNEESVIFRNPHPVLSLLVFLCSFSR